MLKAIDDVVGIFALMPVVEGVGLEACDAYNVGMANLFGGESLVTQQIGRNFLVIFPRKNGQG
jgi:hypothetical protein